MKSLLFSAGILGSLCVAASAGPTRSGRAQVEWISKTTGFSPGEPVVTALKMTLDQGWHTYWINPGEAGMPLSAEFDLPEGWSAESPRHPFPIRFTTGGLADFGYEGTVLFPIILHPPADDLGDAEITGKFSWLTCDDSACIPGDATLTIVLESGGSKQTPAAPEIANALRQVPTQAPEAWKLDVSESADSLTLQLTLPSPQNLEQLDVFPHTLNIVHPAASFEWRESAGNISTRVPKSPFAPDTIESLELVIKSPALDQPLSVVWSSE